MREGYLKEFENRLLFFFDKGGEKELWKELVKIIRKRTGLPQTFDYLQTFAEDCQLVADALEKESTAEGTREGTKPRLHKGDAPGVEWSKIMSKSDIVVGLRLDSVHKLNRLCKDKIFEVRPAGNGKNRQAWQIRIDKLDNSLQKKFRP